MTTESELRFMKIALSMARRGLGSVAPNPSVGCVLVKDNCIIARGHTQPGGRPHAEVNALAKAGSHAFGASAFVTLEPCSHQGKTPPCAQALIDAGVKRVFVATTDPDPRVSGSGIAMLEQAGITVEVGLCRNEANEINAGFFSRIEKKRPLITVKLATTLDGKIALHNGQSKWITGPQARSYGHMIRLQHDAIMVGSTTVVKDDPELTCRLPGLFDHSPLRIIADGRLRTPLTSKLVRTAREHDTLILTRQDVDETRLDAFVDCGVKVHCLDVNESGYLDLNRAMEYLADTGITRLMVEGGARLSASLFQAGLVDRLEWFRSTKIIGGDGLPAIHALGLERMDQVSNLNASRRLKLGDDVLETFVFKS